MAKKILLLLASLLLFLTGAAGCSLGPDAGANSTSPMAAIVLQDPPAPRARSVCLDPTTSTASDFAPSIRTELASVVSAYVPPMPNKPETGVAPIAALRVAVRLVTTAPLAYGEPVTTVAIPAVAGLPPRPDRLLPGALSAGGPYEQWQKAQKTWTTQYQAALTAAAGAAKAISGVDLGLQETSGISGCLSALALTTPLGGDSSFVIASDLEENVPTQSAGSFGGKPLLVIQPCPSGDAQTCATTLAGFTAWATGMKVGQITSIRPEQAADVLRTWIGGAK